MALFTNTINLFLKSLHEEHFARVPEPIRTWHAQEPEGWFGLGPAEQKMKVEELAQYLYALILLFEHDDEITGSEPYQLLQRLFAEQCECVTDAHEPSSKVHVKKKTEGATLQSPYDPDASCGHKGPGYSLHIAETCTNGEKTEIITDYEVHGAARSDMGKALAVVERLEAAGCKPETLFADGGYPSVPSASRVKEKGIEFMTPVNRSRLSEEIIGRDLFHFDSQGLVTQCPMGHTPVDHRVLSNNTTHHSLHAIFDGNLCRTCTMLERCPVRAPNHRTKGCQARDTVGDFRLEITAEIRLRDHMYALQQTTEWKDRYKIRAGIEATNSELKRAHSIGRLRVRRLVKVCFVVACKVIACNIKRWTKAQIALRGPFCDYPSSLGVLLKLWFGPEHTVFVQATDFLDGRNSIVVIL